MDEPSHDDEVRRRWGGTAAYRQSGERTQRYDADDWSAISAEGDSIARRFAELMRAGVAVTDPAALALAEEHRRHIDRWFYDCPPAMHAALGDLYVEDQRFARYWNGYEPGLSVFVRVAIAANAG